MILGFFVLSLRQAVFLEQGEDGWITYLSAHRQVSEGGLDHVSPIGHRAQIRGFKEKDDAIRDFLYRAVPPREVADEQASAVPGGETGLRESSPRSVYE